jgi:cholesterol oxidase
VIVAAGALGSTYLLLRNRDVFLRRLSGRLGTRFSGNGDLLTFALKSSTTQNGRRVPTVIDPGYGPVITSAVRVPDELDGGQGRGFYIEDAGYPDFVSWLVQLADEPLAFWAWRKTALRLVRKWLQRKPETDLSAEVSELFGKSELSAGVLPLLGMGRDVPDGRMFLREGLLDLDWSKDGASGPYFDRVRETMRGLVAALGGKFVDNPIWWLSKVITVHPLGGCPMGRTPQEGVVDAYGEVFGHPGLYVADGAVMPGPVGPNPSLTIAALADRFAERIVSA